MFSKLALNNVKKSIKDYTIYFLTLTFGVCLFYVFNSIHSQQAMLALSSIQNQMLEQLQEMIGMVSVFISVILGFLIVYANRFLIKRRKKELGMYMLLGMEKQKISHVLILETFFIGIFSLIIGLLIGVFASQGLAVFTAKIFHAKMNEFVFIFSPSACVKSIIYFGIIFIIVMIFNTISISKFKLIDLLTASRKNETLKVKKLWISVILFIMSVISLVTAYSLIIENGLLLLNSTFAWSIILGIIGTFLFFLSLSGFLLKVVQMNKKLYFKGLNMFVLRQINSKITTTFVSMTLICLMLFLSIGILSSGAGLAKTMNSNIEKCTPYDLSLVNYSNFNESDMLKKGYVLDRMQEDGIDIASLIKEYAVLSTYDLDVKLTQLMKYYIKDNPNYEKRLGSIDDATVDCIPLSQFNDALKLQGKNPITLQENVFAINCTFDEILWCYKKFINQNDTLLINGKEFHAYPKVMGYSYFTSMASIDIGTIILPDEEFKQSNMSKCIYNIQIKNDVEKNSNLLIEQMDLVYLEKEKPFQNWMFRTELYEQSAGVTTLVSYLAIYIGVIFLITCSAVLALQQLSESSDNIERYKLLRKIGVDKKEINKSVFMQILICFMMPLLLAVIHSFVGVGVANDVIKIIGQIDASAGIIASASGIVIIYGGYMIATYLSCKAMITNKQ